MDVSRHGTHLLDLLRIEFPLTRELPELAHILCEQLRDAFTGDGFTILALEGISEGSDDVRWVLRSWGFRRVRRVHGHRVSAVFALMGGKHNIRENEVTYPTELAFSPVTRYNTLICLASMGDPPHGA